MQAKHSWFWWVILCLLGACRNDLQQAPPDKFEPLIEQHYPAESIIQPLLEKSLQAIQEDDPSSTLWQYAYNLLELNGDGQLDALVLNLSKCSDNGCLLMVFLGQSEKGGFRLIQSIEEVESPVLVETPLGKEWATLAFRRGSRQIFLGFDGRKFKQVEQASIQGDPFFSYLNYPYQAILELRNPQAASLMILEGILLKKEDGFQLRDCETTQIIKLLDNPTLELTNQFSLFDHLRTTESLSLKLEGRKLRGGEEDLVIIEKVLALERRKNDNICK